MKRRDFISKTGAAVAALSILPNAFANTNLSALDSKVIGQKAYDIFNKNKLTCGEAVMLAVCESLGIKDEVVPDITIALSGGIGLQGHVCGAVSGAAVTYSMIAAPKFTERKAKCGNILGASGRIDKGIKEKFKTTNCKSLTHIDFSTAEGKKLFNEKFRAGKCGDIVRVSTELLVEELKKLS